MNKKMFSTFFHIILVAPSRLTRTIPSVAAFMTSLTVITIAMDRFRFIVCSHKTQVNKSDTL